MKNIIYLKLVILTLCFNLGCESNNTKHQHRIKNTKDDANVDSGFTKFDPSKLDSDQPKRKKIVRIVSGNEAFHESNSQED